MIAKRRDPSDMLDHFVHGSQLFFVLLYSMLLLCYNWNGILMGLQFYVHLTT